MMTREEAIEELTMALLYITRFSDMEGSRFGEMAWKNYDYNAIHKLDDENFIVDPSGKRNSKYVWLTEEGRERAREILARYGIPDTPLYEKYEFRKIRQEEAEAAADIEEICFPPNEACSRSMMRERVRTAPELFLVAVERSTGKIAGFLNGLATDESEFRDEFFTDASLYKPDGKNIMLLGLDVLPAHRKQGLGRELVYNYCRREQEKGRRMLVLTCLENKVKMYKKMGFRDRGQSKSVWGGERWHEMDCILY